MSLYRDLLTLSVEDTMFKEIVNRRIIDVTLDAAKETLTFYTMDGMYTYEAYGDCCSESWVESTDPLEELTGAMVNRIETSQSTVDGTRQDVDQIDFVTLVTDKGYWKLEFRNSSNGYYGGYMHLIVQPGGLTDD